MKPMTITLNDVDFQRWKNLQGLPGQAWKFWKDIFSRHPILRATAIGGNGSQILHMRYVNGSEFRIEYSDRKLSERSIKALKAMNG